MEVVVVEGGEGNSIPCPLKKVTNDVPSCVSLLYCIKKRMSLEENVCFYYYEFWVGWISSASISFSFFFFVRIE